MISAPYSDVRRDYILVQHGPERHALHVLLRVAGAESPQTFERLRSLGLVPEHGADSVSWTLETDDVGRALRGLAEALGPDALFEAGTSFDAASARRLTSALPHDWCGRYLLHVGGTRRCLVLDRNDHADIERAFRREEAEFFAHDFHPATE